LYEQQRSAPEVLVSKAVKERTNESIDDTKDDREQNKVGVPDVIVPHHDLSQKQKDDHLRNGAQSFGHVDDRSERFLRYVVLNILFLNESATRQTDDTGKVNKLGRNVRSVGEHQSEQRFDN
jgi:hypothetical protein